MSTKERRSNKIRTRTLLIKKIYSISVYDYVDMLNEEIGFKWNEDNIWFPSQHLYNGKGNSKHIAQNKRKK